MSAARTGRRMCCRTAAATETTRPSVTTRSGSATTTMKTPASPQWSAGQTRHDEGARDVRACARLLRASYVPAQPGLAEQKKVRPVPPRRERTSLLAKSLSADDDGAHGGWGVDVGASFDGDALHARVGNWRCSCLVLVTCRVGLAPARDLTGSTGRACSCRGGRGAAGVTRRSACRRQHRAG